jgi:hypothetical protein
MDRFGKDSVFVDFEDIPPGKKWPEVLERKLDESVVLLAIIGPKWGDVRFPKGSGKKTNKLRLEDPDDWVRREICTAIRRGPEVICVVVVPIDDATLPETGWDCELDGLPDIQQARIRNQSDFEGDSLKLCEWLETQVPELKRAAEARRDPITDRSDRALRHYLDAELHDHATIQLPLVSQSGHPVITPIDGLRIDLPLIISHDHAPIDAQTVLRWIGWEVLFIHEQIRGTHANALLVDRASQFEDLRRDCDIAQKLGPGGRIVVVGDPGCGKSTLLQWIGGPLRAFLRTGRSRQSDPEFAARPRLDPDPDPLPGPGRPALAHPTRGPAPRPPEAEAFPRGDDLEPGR